MEAKTLQTAKCSWLYFEGGACGQTATHEAVSLSKSKPYCSNHIRNMKSMGFVTFRLRDVPVEKER
jgi:hypothetical protein